MIKQPNKPMMSSLAILLCLLLLNLQAGGVLASNLDSQLVPKTVSVDESIISAEQANNIGTVSAQDKESVLSTSSEGSLESNLSLDEINNYTDAVDEITTETTKQKREIAVREALNTASNVIYLNGETGNDANDGSSPTQALLTFSKAKELATSNQAITQIFVCGKTEITGDITLQGTQAKVYRAPDYKGYLFTVTKDQTASLKEIVVDGSLASEKAEESLIYVEEGTLNIAEGTILQNNDVKHPKDGFMSTGGAVKVVRGMLNMTGGIMQNNQATYGGGVYLSKSTMTMTGGSIQQNRSDLVIDRPTRQLYSAGGGVTVYQGSTFNFGGTAEIKDNTAFEIGGGISVGTNQWSEGDDTLNMTGGTVSGNKAGASGGGIFVQAGLFVQHIARAYISAGQIINNEMTGKGYTAKAFGGGGIYVNGGPTEWHWQGNVYYMKNGELHLTNALITDNEAIEGAGLASCPISKTYMYVKDGCIVAKNKAETGRAQDVYMSSSNNPQDVGYHTGEAEYAISKRMLGGALYDWHYADGTPVPDDKLQGTLPSGQELELTAYADIKPEAKALAKVIITGNKSTTRGGGIGSNGTIFMGDDKPRKDLEILKEWASSLTKEEVTVELRGKLGDKDWLIETIKLNEANGFKHICKDLPEKVLDEPIENIVYIKELQSDKYKPEIGRIEEAPSVKTLSFNLWRPQASDNENLNAVYQNYHMDDLSTGVFNQDKWALNDFDVKYVLKDSQGQKLAEAKMSMREEGLNWQDKAEFKNIPITTDAVEVEYYDDIDEDGDPAYFAPWLLEYEVKLEVKDNKTIIKVPNLWPMNRDPLTGSEEERVIKVKDLKTESKTGNKQYRIKVVNKQPLKPLEPLKTQIKVVKEWQDNNDSAHKRPAAIIVELQQNGNKLNTVTLSSANNWQHTFSNLPLYDDMGKKYVYTVKETEVKGYKSELSGNAQTGFKLTNSLIPDNPPPIVPPPITPPSPEIPLVPFKPGRVSKTGEHIAIGQGAYLIVLLALAKAISKKH